MRTVALLLLTAALLAANAAPGWAQTPAPKAEEKKTEAKKPAGKTISGTVKSASADTVVVTGKDKGKETEWTFAIDPKTTIKKGGKDLTPADLKAGDPVQVRYREEGGKQTAQAITVRSAGMAKKAQEAKPETKK